MHRDRNHGTWLELKAKRHNKLDDAPLESLGVMPSHLVGEAQDTQKIKKDRAAMQLSRVQNMLKDMADFYDKQGKRS